MSETDITDRELTKKDASEGRICRICLKNAKIMLPIFGSGAKDNFDTKMMKCADVQVKTGDGLPNSICLECVTLLMSATLFRDTCERSDRQLRKLAEEKAPQHPGCSNNDDVLVDQGDAFDNPWTPVEMLKDAQPCPDISPIPTTLSLDAVLTIPEDIKGKKMSKRTIIKKALDTINIENLLRSRENVGKTQKKEKSKTVSICDICGKRLANAIGLKNHMLIHNGELPFQCTMCPHKTRLEHSLKIHMRVHSGERPYLCSLCPKLFITASNLKKHVRYHQNVRPHKCHVCAKELAEKKSLEDHIANVHMGYKRYVCTVCEERFPSQKTLRGHKVRKHQIVPKRRCVACPPLPKTASPLNQDSKITQG